MPRYAKASAVAVAAALLTSTLLIAAVAAAGPVTSIPVGQSPQRIVVDPLGRLVYVARSGSLGGVVTVINAVDGTISGDVDLPGLTTSMVLDPAGGGVLVGINNSSQVQRVRGGSLSLGTTLAVPYAAGAMAVDPAANRLFMFGEERICGSRGCDGRRVHIVAVDLADGSMVANLVVPNSGSLALDPLAGRLYATGGSLSVSAYDSSDLDPVATITTARRVDTIAVDPGRSRLYALGGNAGEPHTIIDTATDTVVGALASTGIPINLAVDQDRGLVYTSNGSGGGPDPGHVAIYDSEALVETVPMGTQPGAIGIDASNGNAWVTDEFDANVTVIGSLTATPPDADDDGTADSIDADGGAGTSPAGSFSDDTGDGFVTTGAITDAAGLSVEVDDAADPDGVRITVGAGSGDATLSVCGGFTVRIDAGSSVVVTCGSVTLAVTSGSAEIVLGGGLTVVTVPSGGEARVTDTGGGIFTIANTGDEESIGVTVDGTPATIEPGATSSAAAWDFVGFSQPIDNLPVRNKVKAGQGIPVKWRVLDAAGAPVTGLTSAGLTVSSLACTAGASIDQIETTTSGGTGLTNLGDGYYELVWKTPKAYGSSCRTLHLDIGDGVTHDAAFEFTK